jgi:hypothetical protein
VEIEYEFSEYIVDCKFIEIMESVRLSEKGNISSIVNVGDQNKMLTYQDLMTNVPSVVTQISGYTAEQFKEM